MRSLKIGPGLALGALALLVGSVEVSCSSPLVCEDLSSRVPECMWGMGSSSATLMGSAGGADGGGASDTILCRKAAAGEKPVGLCEVLKMTSAGAEICKVSNGEVHPFAGDCKRLICDGKGNFKEEPDMSDIYTGDPCITLSCEPGVPAPKGNVGISCTIPQSGTPGVCNALGRCVDGCSQAHPCTAPGTTCDTDSRICFAASCGDGTKNGNESDVDCGGPNCKPCDVGQMCALRDAYCASASCKESVQGSSSLCLEASCEDKKRSGGESAIDCGHVCRSGKLCDDLHTCSQPADCLSGVCLKQCCQPATCTDGVKNGAEDGIDCGDDCPTACPAAL
jgi:hypothetical protein